MTYARLSRPSRFWISTAAVFGLAAMLAVVPPGLRAQGGNDRNGDFESARARMIETIQARARAAAPRTGVPAIDRRVLDAMVAVPRHAFVPAPLAPYAYSATPLPLTQGQNLASPYIVALMTHLAEIAPGDRVFETGTGAGYHAAVLAELGAEVVSVEVLPALANRARANLAPFGPRRIETHIADGYYGWPKGAPYDAILVKEALDHLPEPLVAQLAPGGRLVLPLGPLDGRQNLTVVTKSPEGEGTLERRRVLPVRFSPLQGGQRI